MPEQCSTPSVRLRPTRLGDLALVLELEGDPDNSAFIGSWSHAEHAATIGRSDRQHWIVEQAGSGEPLGYLIAYDSTSRGGGVYLKRMAVREKGRGVGRAALDQFLRHARDELGAEFVWLAVVPENQRAQRVYRSLGFRVHPERAENGNLLMFLGEAPEPAGGPAA